MSLLAPLLPGGTILWPLLAAAILCLVRDWRLGARLNLVAACLTLVLAIGLLDEPAGGGVLLRVDPLGAALALLSAFVGATTAWFSQGYVASEVETGRLTEARLRLYHACFQAFSAAIQLGLLADNLGVLWIAIETGTIVTVLMTALYRTAPAIEAAWKTFILCGVGIALALFGTVLLYLAALPALGPGWAAMSWTALRATSARFNPAVLNLAFAFLAVGYGTKAGLVPTHAWLPDAHAEGPTPISAILSGLLLNVALAALVRLRGVMAGNADAAPPGSLLMIAGLASLLLAAFSLWQRRDAKRFFAWSSVEHMGIAAFGFGLGGLQATTAALLHLVMHAIIKPALFFALGAAAQARAGQRFRDLAGVGTAHPALGIGLAFLMAAIAGLPPFGLFAAEFLLLTRSIAAAPVLSLLLAIGLVVALAAIVARGSELLFGAPPGQPVPVESSSNPYAQVVPGQRLGAASVLGPLYLHLAVASLGGVFLPQAAGAWLQRVAASVA